MIAITRTILCRGTTLGSVRASKWLLSATLFQLPFLFAQKPAPDPLREWMDRIAQQQLQQGENGIAEIRTVADAERRKKVVRQTLLDMLGGLREHNGPFNERIRA